MITLHIVISVVVVFPSIIGTNRVRSPQHQQRTYTDIFEPKSKRRVQQSTNFHLRSIYLASSQTHNQQRGPYAKQTISSSRIMAQEKHPPKSPVRVREPLDRGSYRVSAPGME